MRKREGIIDSYFRQDLPDFLDMFFLAFQMKARKPNSPPAKINPAITV